MTLGSLHGAFYLKPVRIKSGTVVECYLDCAVVEIANEDGETLALLDLPYDVLELRESEAEAQR